MDNPRIVWQKPDGSISVTTPIAAQLESETQAEYLSRLTQQAQSVDSDLAGAVSVLVDASQLPQRIARSAWRVVNGQLVVDQSAAQAQAAVIAAKQVEEARAIVTDRGPTARANRAMARLIAKRLGDVIDTVNVLVARENARIRPPQPPIPTLTKTPWPQLLQAVKATIAAEVDPEA